MYPYHSSQISLIISEILLYSSDLKAKLLRYNTNARTACPEADVSHILHIELKLELHRLYLSSPYTAHI